MKLYTYMNAKDKKKHNLQKLLHRIEYLFNKQTRENEAFVLEMRGAYERMIDNINKDHKVEIDKLEDYAKSLNASVLRRDAVLAEFRRRCNNAEGDKKWELL